MIEPVTRIDSIALERVIRHVSESLVEDDLPRDKRVKVWELLRSLIAMRSQERVAQMERKAGLR